MLRAHFMYGPLSYQIIELEDSGLPQQGILPISAKKRITMATEVLGKKDSSHCGLEVVCDIAARTKSAPSLCAGDLLRDPDLLCPPPLLALEIRRRRLELRLLDLRRLVGDLGDLLDRS